MKLLELEETSEDHWVPLQWTCTARTGCPGIVQPCPESLLGQDITTFLDSLFQCVITFTVKGFFLILHLNLPLLSLNISCLKYLFFSSIFKCFLYCGRSYFQRFLIFWNKREKVSDTWLLSALWEGLMSLLLVIKKKKWWSLKL